MDLSDHINILALIGAFSIVHWILKHIFEAFGQPFTIADCFNKWMGRLHKRQAEILAMQDRINTEIEQTRNAIKSALDEKHKKMTKGL